MEDGSSALLMGCDATCGPSTCAYFNISFSCEELATSFSCLCDGCCYHEALPLGQGFVMLIFLGCVWSLFMVCHCYYRFYAYRDARHAFGGRVPPRSAVAAGDVELTNAQEDVLRRRRRYEVSGINIFLPFVAICCPGLHRFYHDSATSILKDIRNCWDRCRGRAVTRAREVKGAVKETSKLARQKTVAVATSVESGVSKTASYLNDGLKEHNVKGLTLHSAIQIDHGKKSTSTSARGILVGSSSVERGAGAGSPKNGAQGAGGAEAADLEAAHDAEAAQQLARAAIGGIAHALVAVAQGGSAKIRGSADEIVAAAERLERAASQARRQVALARGMPYQPLRSGAESPTAASAGEGQWGRVSAMLGRRRSVSGDGGDPAALSNASKVRLTPQSDALNGQRVDRMKKLEAAQHRAEEAQRKALELQAELERTEHGLGAIDEQSERTSFASSGGRLTRQPSVASSTGPSPPGILKRLSTKMLGADKRSPAASVPAEQPKWSQLLGTYTEQLQQIEGWLAMEPTEEELADGSAIEKALTLITARDDLTAKIQQLEAVAAAHAMSDSPAAGKAHGRFERTISFSGGSI